VAYSRWTSSVWYTFWATSDSNHINEQIFMISTFKCFTYKELKYNLDNCLRLVKGLVTDKNMDNKLRSDESIRELKKYMTNFIYDVEKEYMLVHNNTILPKQVLPIHRGGDN